MRLPILIFTGLFLFEPFYFVLSISDLPVPDLPLGVLFGLATFALSYRYIKQPHYMLPLLLIFFSMVAVYISARRSEWFDYEWVVLFAWYISKFILGYALADVWRGFLGTDPAVAAGMEAIGHRNFAHQEMTLIVMSGVRHR